MSFTVEEHRELRALNDEAETLVVALEKVKAKVVEIVQKADARQRVEEIQGQAAEPLDASSGGSLRAD